ncbi:phytochelatin synthase family protein [Francisella sp. LA112445]|uniref:phytochelatin synthase family protein n=1 Tax=Francisella sp. LA112445 TaxID=1395624 RepID=UPI001788DBA2|nr:phytochelatin synthase family protein [Francisella sp. LA112445]QIW10300.1 hypothetical protein FIP56_06165 [Francisella sp. LA112445]
MKKTIIFFFAFILLLSTNIYAKPLTLPKNVVSFSSPQGQKLLKTAPEKYSQQYWQLAKYFTTENGVSFCGPASDVMVLNALGIQPALAPAHMQYSIFDQNNIFYNKSLIEDQIMPAFVYAKGLTIEQTAEIINKQETIGAKAHAIVIHANEFSNEKDFKNKLLNSMKDSKYIIINYNRADMGAQGGGHFSPLAAYNPNKDMWLLMDVARYKYPPAWIKTSDLYKAIQAKDSSSGKPRGVIIVSKES